MSDILKQKQVTTRKPHNCWGCAREFPTGTVLLFIKSVDDGLIFSIYWCEVCQEVLRECADSDSDDEYNYGEVTEYDYWEEARLEIEGERQIEKTKSLTI